MSHLREEGIFISFLNSYFPNKKDNIKQIIIKLLFLLSFVGIVVSSVYIGNYFLTAEREEKVIEASRDIWYGESENDAQEIGGYVDSSNKIPSELLKEQNPDFKGWITLAGANVDNPIYQSYDNEYYLNHNQNKQRSIYGALFFESTNVITEENVDRNLVVYGHEMKNGSMFGSLKKLKNLSFYKENSLIELTVNDIKANYRIYAVFILNAKKEDDNGYVYNIYRQNFINKSDFENWVNEAQRRSIIDTKVAVDYDDDILTLVTCSEDFPNARLVVMAKKLGAAEIATNENTAAKTNSAPLYPQKWYDKRGIKREEN